MQTDLQRRKRHVLRKCGRWLSLPGRFLLIAFLVATTSSGLAQKTVVPVPATSPTASSSQLEQLPQRRLPIRRRLDQLRFGNNPTPASATPLQNSVAGDFLLPSLALPDSRMAGPIPTGVAVGDFNRDGKLDWVVANGGDGTLWLFLGNGDGTAQAPRALWPGGKLLSLYFTNGIASPAPVPIWVAALDLRGNGILDLLITEANENYTMAVMLGNGDGTFQPAQRYSINCDGTDIATADINRDGKQDVIVGCYAGTFTAFFGDGKGGLTRAAGVVSSSPEEPPSSGTETLSAAATTGGRDLSDPAPTVLDLGDYNRDGFLDIAVATSGATPGVLVYQGLGDGRFTRVQTVIEGHYCRNYCSSYWATAVKFVDADQDGYLDIVFADNSGGAAVFKNRHDGTFDPNGRWFPVGGLTADMAITDINGDGYPDVITSSILIEAEPGYGTMAPDLISVSYGDGQGGFGETRVFRGGASMVALAMGDINGDGKPDIITADQLSETYTVFLNDGTGGFLNSAVEGKAVSLSNTPISGLLLQDVDGDGRTDLSFLDVSFRNQTFSLVTYYNRDGKFSSPSRVFDIPEPVQGGHFLLADFRNTGKQDFLFTAEQTWFAPNLGGGRFGTPVQLPNIVGTQFETADLNADGKLDVVAVLYQFVTTYQGNGDGTFIKRQQLSLGSCFSSQVYLQDVNRDGMVDVLVWCGNYNNAGLYQFIGNGDGTLQSPQLLFSTGRPTFADLNHDGQVDFVALDFSQNPAPPSISVYLGKRDGGFEKVQSYKPYSGYAQAPSGAGTTCNWPLVDLIVGDFDGDGNDDIVVPQTAAGIDYFQIMRGNGDATFTATYRMYYTFTMGPLYAVDVNGDGRSELVEWNKYAASFQVLPGISAVKRAAPVLLQTAIAGDSGTVRIVLDAPSASGQTVEVRSPDPSLVLPSFVSFGADEWYKDVPFTVSSPRDPAQMFTIIASLGNVQASTYGRQAFNPIPRLDDFVIPITYVGSPGFVQRVLGQDFVPTSVVFIDGKPRVTRIISNAILEIDITAADLAVADCHTLSVVNPAPGGGESNTHSFCAWSQPSFQITKLIPDHGVVGASGLSLNVWGQSFTTSSIVRVNGKDRPTTLVTSGSLYGQLSADDLSLASVHEITVYDPANGGVLSNSLQLPVRVNNAPTGEIESVGSEFDGSTTLGTRGTLLVKGWAADQETATSVNIRLNGNSMVWVNTDQPRPDIAARFNKPEWGRSGFIAWVFPQQPGTFNVQAFARDDDNTTSELTNLSNKTITVVPSTLGTPWGEVEKLFGSNNSTTVPKTGKLLVSGWAAVGSTDLAGAVRIYLDNVYALGEAQLGISRPDVAATYDVPVNSGFTFEIELKDVALGSHIISVNAYNVQGVARTIGSVTINVVADPWAVDRRHRPSLHRAR